MRIMRDTNGIEWRIDEVLTGVAARRQQVYPGYGTLYVSPPTSPSSHHYGVTIPEWMIDSVVKGEMAIKIGNSEKG